MRKSFPGFLSQENEGFMWNYCFHSNTETISQYNSSRQRNKMNKIWKERKSRHSSRKLIVYKKIMLWLQLQEGLMIKGWLTIHIVEFYDPTNKWTEKCREMWEHNLTSPQKCFIKLPFPLLIVFPFKPHFDQDF